MLAQTPCLPLRREGDRRLTTVEGEILKRINVEGAQTFRGGTFDFFRAACGAQSARSARDVSNSAELD